MDLILAAGAAFNAGLATLNLTHGRGALGALNVASAVFLILALLTWVSA